MSTTLAPYQKLILFDGVCNLCNSSVKFIIKRDKQNVFRFASLQSPLGQKMVDRFGWKDRGLKSIILVDPQGQYFMKSTAALEIARELPGYKWMRVFLYLPRFLRDGIYNLVARNRYRLFGKKQECMVPTPGLKEKFMDNQAVPDTWVQPE